MKISFTNTISQISDKETNIDTSKILYAIGQDSRIGNKYLSLGALYSGPCFPRDNLNFSKYLCCCVWQCALNRGYTGDRFFFL